MHALFLLGEHACAEDIRLQLTNPPSSSAVRAMLTRLEAKGHIRHRAEGLRYVYSPTTPRAAARRVVLHELVKVYFDGSPGQAALALLKHENWTDAELDALAHELERIRTQRRQLPME